MLGRVFLAEGTDSTEALRQKGVQWEYMCESRRRAGPSYRGQTISS